MTELTAEQREAIRAFMSTGLNGDQKELIRGVVREYVNDQQREAIREFVKAGLNAEQKEPIKEYVNAYLRSWLVALGITSLISVVAGSVAAFIYISKTIVSNVVAKLTDDKQFTDLRERAMNDAKAASAKILKVQELLQNLNGDKAVQVAKAAEAMDKDPNFAVILKLPDRVSRLESIATKQHRMECKIEFKGEGHDSQHEYNKSCGEGGYDWIMNAYIYSMSRAPEWQSLCCRIVLKSPGEP